MITPILKDQILFDFVNNRNVSFDILYKDALSSFGTDRDTFVIILKYFEQKGLLYIKKGSEFGEKITLTVNAYDLVRLGGFIVEEEILKANIEKLGLEIDLLSKRLSPDLLDSVQKLSSISHSILSALSFIGN